MPLVRLDELQKDLRKYLRLAAGGQTVYIVERDCVLAELIAPRERRPLEPVNDAALLQLMRRGSGHAAKSRTRG